MKAVTIPKTKLYFRNPKTGNPVCYERARQLGLLKQKNVKFGVLDPKTRRLNTVKRAQEKGLLKDLAA